MILYSLRKERWVLISSVVVFLMLGYLRVFTSPPIYQTDALLQIEKGKVLAGLEQLEGLLTPQESLSAEVELLRSRRLLSQVVEQLGLNISIRPDYFPVIGEAMARRAPKDRLAEPFLGFNRYAWGGERLDLERLEVSLDRGGVSFGIAVGEPGQFVLIMSDGRRFPGRTGQSLSVDYLPGIPLQLTVRDIRAAEGLMFRVRVDQPVRAAQSLRGKLEISSPGAGAGDLIPLKYSDTDRDLAVRVLNAIIQRYLRESVERRSQDAESMIVFIQEQLPVLQRRAEEAEQRLRAYRESNRVVGLNDENQNLLARLVEVDRLLSEVELQSDELSVRYTAEHPAIRALDARRGALNASRAEINAAIGELPDSESEFLRLSRDVEVANALYVTLLNRSQEIRIAKAGVTGNVSIIDTPIRPSGPIKPKPLLIMTLSGALGLIVGGALALARRLMDQGVHRAEVIERDLGLSVFASVLHSEAQEQLTRLSTSLDGKTNTRILAYSQPEDAAVESLRSLRTSLQFALMDAPNNVVMFTGPTPGVGKSFTSSNLAALIAQAGKRVVLVDADLRKGLLHKVFGFQEKTGLSTVLSGTSNLDEQLVAVNPSLYVLPRGTVPPNPSELLMSERFSEMLKRLSTHFDFVIIDTPPILLVTDAAIVARSAGTNFLVVKAGLHSLGDIAEAAKRLALAAPVAGVILNDVDPRRRGYYGYGYYAYGYRYAYKYKA